jgi:hypothetical protein
MMLQSFKPTTKSYSVVNKKFTGKGKRGELYGLPGEFIAKERGGKTAMGFVPEFVNRRATKGQILRHRVGGVAAAATHPLTMGFAGATALEETAKKRQPMTGATYF